MIIDTHCHLIDQAFQSDVEEVIRRAQEADVQKIVLACCDESELQPIITLCQKHPNTLYPTIGIHPENMEEDVHAQFEKLYGSEEAEKNLHLFRAVGEIGLDLHWDRTRLADQQWLLTAQIDWALQHDLPLLLHIRDAMEPFLEQCRQELLPRAERYGKPLRGILHCYSGTIEQAQEAMKMGDFYIGIGGTLTYKKSTVPEIAQAVGLDRIVLETDAPYLAPIPQRGHRNEPAFTQLTCQALAGILGCTPQEVADRTTRNAQELLTI
ncbi:MAG: TatD family hydrolase [Bacteroidales bacterium]|nr:TatD family hydrolase [Bacteroidales bacterium]